MPPAFPPDDVASRRLLWVGLSVRIDVSVLLPTLFPLSKKKTRNLGLCHQPKTYHTFVKETSSAETGTNLLRFVLSLFVHTFSSSGGVFIASYSVTEMQEIWCHVLKSLKGAEPGS